MSYSLLNPTPTTRYPLRFTWDLDGTGIPMRASELVGRQR